MIISLVVRALDSPISVRRPSAESVFETAGTEVVDTVIVTVSDDGVSRVFGFDSAAIAIAR
jgi:hypothetical protein